MMFEIPFVKLARHAKKFRIPLPKSEMALLTFRIALEKSEDLFLMFRMAPDIFTYLFPEEFTGLRVSLDLPLIDMPNF